MHVLPGFRGRLTFWGGGIFPECEVGGHLNYMYVRYKEAMSGC